MSGTSTVSAVLESDHRRLDALLEEAWGAARGSSLDAAAATFERFRTGLEKHIDVEEQVLFPAFERHTGMTSGPTHVMRMEHEAIRDALQQASDALRRLDAAGFTAAATTLERLLADHNIKEEGVLYPMADRALRPAEVAEVTSGFESP